MGEGNRVSITVLVAVTELLGCGAADDGEETARVRQEILRGSPVVNDPVYNVRVRVSGAAGDCSGTLLTNSWVVTARHCVADTPYYNWTVDPTPADVRVSLANDSSQWRNVAFFELHDVGLNADVALLGLAGGFWLGGTTLRRPLYWGSNASLGGMTATCFGVGYSQIMNGDQTLRSAYFTLGADSPPGLSIYTYFPNPQNWIQSFGDSGGGCFVYSNGTYYLAGVTSNGLTPTEPFSAVQHTGIPAMRNWIEEKLFSGGEPLGGGVGTPAAVAPALGRLALAAVGVNSRVKVQTWNQGGSQAWSGWNQDIDSPPGGSYSSPAMVSGYDGQIDLFILGAFGAIWHRWYNDAFGWNGQGWQSLGAPLAGACTSAPTAASWEAARVDLFCRDNNNNIAHQWYHWPYVGWTGFVEHLGAPPGGATSDSAAVSSTNGRVDIFVRGYDNAIWWKYFWGTWSGWQSLGFNAKSAPAVTKWPSGRIDLFVKGDFVYYHKVHDPNGWWADWGITPTYGSPALYSGKPAVVAWGEGRLDLFGYGTNNLIWHQWSPR